MGLVCISVCDARRASGRRAASPAASVLPGGRADIRDRSVTVAMHMLRRLLLGESDEPRAPVAPAPPPTPRRASTPAS